VKPSDTPFDRSGTAPARQANGDAGRHGTALPAADYTRTQVKVSELLRIREAGRMNVVVVLALTGHARAAADRVAELLAGSATLAVAFSASSSPRRLVDPVLDAAELSGLFQVTVSTEEVEAAGPFPEVYQAVMQEPGWDGACRRAIENCADAPRSASPTGCTMLPIPRRPSPPAPHALGRLRHSGGLLRSGPLLIAQPPRDGEEGRA
jgi:hypothetical protein